MWLRDVVPFVAMVIVECLDVGLTTLSKAAMSRGMSHFIFVFYSNALATLILFPASFILEWKNRPPLTFPLICRVFLLGFLWITIMQNCVFTGISYSSPTLGSAMSNVVPAFTFVLAVTFRLEKVDIKKSSSQAKLMGTLVSITGALMVTLYRGPPLKTLSHIHQPSPLITSFTSKSKGNWVVGALFLASASLSLSIWNTLQAATVKAYPAELTLVSFNLLFGAMQCAIVCLITEREASAWKLRPDIELISIVYSAVIGSVASCSVLTWCMLKRGPLFVAMFKPIGIGIAAIMGVIFLGDTLFLGSLIGAVMISFGFYVVVWGQAKEKNERVQDLAPSTLKTPLLQNNTQI